MSQAHVDSVTRAGDGRLCRFPLLARLCARLRARPDSEHEMTANRIVLSGVTLVYLAISSSSGGDAARQMLEQAGFFFAVYDLVALALFCHILWRPDVSPARRLIGIALDIGLFSYGMHVGDEAAAPLYPIYLWVVLGNGFRFGIPYLIAAAGAAVVGFGVTVAATPFWQTHLAVGIGLVAGLVVIPLYVSTLIRRLSEAKRQAEQASRAKSQFLASVSHELRTPLNAVIAFSDLLRDSPLENGQRDMARMIGSSGRSLLTHINSILDFSRIEAGQMPSSQVDFDLYAMLTEIRAMLAVQANAKGVRLSLHVSPRVPRLVRGDRVHLEKMLVNLGGNATKFTDRGYVVISVDAPAQDGDQVRLRFEVSDTGIGIAPDAQARIFERFTQADETIIDRFGGTGLGLAIVKQLVELHGGEIGVHSTPGLGSTFWAEIAFEGRAGTAQDAVAPGPVTVLTHDRGLAAVVTQAGAEARIVTDVDAALAEISARREAGERHPIAVIDARALADDVEAAAERLAGDDVSHTTSLVLITDSPVEGVLVGTARSLFVTALARPVDTDTMSVALRLASHGIGTAATAAVAERQPRRILVAEDNRTNQKVIAKILERAGHSCDVVDDGEAALRALDGGAFDLVLMDVNMPVMNGIEATKLYRFAALGRPRVPIVALTADATGEARERCLDAGMDACATKPIEPAQLLDLIDSLTADDEGAPVIDGDAVTAIASHPKFRPGTGPAVNLATLKDLEALGGRAFVDEVIEQFLGDADEVLRELDATVAAGDAVQFREQIHALRSSAANVGARGIYEMCLTWRQIGAGELTERGAECMQLIADEFVRVRSALTEILGEHGVTPPATSAATTPNARVA